MGRQPRGGDAQAWIGAAFLHERRPDRAPLDDARRAAGARRLGEWEAQMLAEPALFERRLRAAGLGRGALARLLTAPGRVRADAGAFHAWLDALARIMRAAAIPHQELGGTGFGDAPRLPFGGFFRPFLADATARLQAGIAALGTDAAQLTPEAERELGMALYRRLFAAAAPTLVLELNVARLEGRLSGTTPQERLRHFSEEYFEAPGTRLALLREYPVLARMLVTAAGRWVEAVLELLARLRDERELLARECFGGTDPGRLTSVALGLSDPHRGGRSVAALHFESGRRLIYKPRRLAADRIFQELLDWLSDGMPHRQRTLRVLDRATHGWVEYVEAGACATPDEVRRFYWRQGSYLALLHVLRAADFHYENLIAAGEHPVLVDLEALFQQRLEIPDDGSARARAQRLLARSIVGIGLLPVLTLGAGRRAADLSGFGGRAGEVYPRPLPVLREQDSDRMHIASADVPLVPARNRPKLGERDVDPGDHVDAIVDGFEHTHARLRERRGALSERLRAFADAQVRFVARPTLRYALFLQEGWHPDYLRDALARERLLDKLWAEAVRAPELAPLVPAEQDDLRLGDIPVFTFRPGGRDLEDSSGRRYERFFARPSLDAALEQAAALDDHDSRVQADLIRQAVVPAGGPSVTPPPQPACPAEPYTPETVLSAAVAAAERLARQAVHGDDDSAWIGPMMRPGEHWRWELAPLTTSLYEGVAGVTLFLAYAARLSGHADLEELARRAAVAVRARLEARDAPGQGDIGAFSGRAGLVYVGLHLASLWGEDAWLDAALGALPQLTEQVDADTGLDLISGSAGCALVMLALHRRTGAAAALELARRCGQRLLATAQPQERGLGWVAAAARRPLAGLSHGVAGIAWALFELGAATSDERLHAAALAGLEFERTLFDAASSSWVDQRELGGREIRLPMFAWCHGAPGIALARASTLAHHDDARVRDEIRTAVEQTLQSGLGGSQSLCHGDLGTLDVIGRAADIVQVPAWREARQPHVARVVAECAAGRWRCGLPRGTETPGLMTGIAGIGYGLLRLYDPLRVPSVLWLEAPSDTTAPGVDTIPARSVPV